MERSTAFYDQVNAEANGCMPSSTASFTSARIPLASNVRLGSAFASSTASVSRATANQAGELRERGGGGDRRGDAGWALIQASAISESAAPVLPDGIERREDTKPFPSRLGDALAARAFVEISLTAVFARQETSSPAPK